MRRLFGFLLSAAVCGFALWKGMQAVAIVSLLAALATIFSYSARRVFETALRLLGDTRQAKLGNLEVQVSRQLEDISDRIVRRAAWVHILLSQLRSDDVGLLLSISKEERYPASPALKSQLRLLREKGLLHHDKPTMEESSAVWLSELGKDLASLLLEGEDLGASQGEAVPLEEVAS